MINLKKNDFIIHREKLGKASVDSNFGVVPIFKPRNEVVNNRVVDILDESVDISAIDVAADEIAELVSSHTFNVRMDETFSSTVVSFKPVVGTISSSS